MADDKKDEKVIGQHVRIPIGPGKYDDFWDKLGSSVIPDTRLFSYRVFTDAQIAVGRAIDLIKSIPISKPKPRGEDPELDAYNDGIKDGLDLGISMASHVSSVEELVDKLKKCRRNLE